MTSTSEPATGRPVTEQFTTPVEIVICADCASVLANGTDGWGLEAAGRELGEVHAARMRESEASVGCLDGIPEGAEQCPDHAEWLSAARCELCCDDRLGPRLSAVEFWVRPEAIEEFLAGYVQCAFWSSTDEAAVPLDARFEPGDLSAAAWLGMRADCWDFVHANLDRLDAYVRAGRSIADAGGDFWLTRNRHGAGFWDRGLGELGDKLTAAAHPYGSCELHVGEDGAVHVN
ncbi:MAG TPA: hypothetical protein VHV82_00315 [Sporichthyaceae bacterium]|jgi:hypothetical protein|nr:hypothetical protein [Sporichthyaceae bacterium]